MKDAILYVHGRCGDPAEARRYETVLPGWDVFGVPMEDFTPWGAQKPIREAFDRLSETHGRVVLLANSIGAYFAMLALQDRAVPLTMLISPILDMETLILRLMALNGVTEERLEREQFIPVPDGDPLSWEYLCWVRKNPVSWHNPTEILYAGRDALTERETVDRFADYHHAGLTVMEDGEHWFHTDEQLQMLDAWLREKVAAEREPARPLTYCNPFSVPDCPKGRDFPHVMDFTGEPEVDYRSISDPSVLYHKGVWYLYPSYGMAWASADFVHWIHRPIDPEFLGYSPAIAVRGDEVFLTGHSHPLYVSDNPLGPFTLLGDFIRPDGTHFCPVDPALFCDDDGELYLYMFDYRVTDDSEVFMTRTLAARLCREDPRQLATEPVELNRFCSEHVWERFGQRNQDTEVGWVEGQWMVKHGGRYYLIYSGSGTQFASYAMGVYVSDEGPLSGFKYQQRNPLTESRRGLVNGAGHGCVVEGPGDSLWAFFTSAISYAHVYERRIGMAPVYVDGNGELTCTVADTPQFAPGTAEALRGEPDTGLLPLTLYMRDRHRASSHTEGRDPLYALDESLLSWWQPAPEDPEPWLAVDLAATYEVEAVRIIWREVGLDYASGAVPAPIRFLLEGAPTVDGAFSTLIDETDDRLEENIVYRTFDPTPVSCVRLTLTGWGKGLQPGVISFCVFGKRKRKEQ